MGKEGNVAHQNDIVEARHFLECAAEHFLVGLLVAGKQFAIGFCNARRRVQQAFAGGIVTCPAQQRADCLFGFLLGWTNRLLCLVLHLFLAGGRKILHNRIHLLSPDAVQGRIRHTFGCVIISIPTARLREFAPFKPVSKPVSDRWRGF
ncbi:hypothetical protein D3C87_1655370 [compost metagenome]